MNFNRPILRNDDADFDLGGGGGDDTDFDLPDNLFDGDGNHIGGDAEPPDQPQQQSRTPVVDPEAIASAVARGLASSQQQQQSHQSPEEAAAEFRKLTKYYGVTEADIKDLVGEFRPPEGAQLDPKEAQQWYATRIGALQRMLDGQATHAAHVTKHMIDYALRQALAPYQPLLEQQRDTVAKTFVSQIAEAVPALKGAEPVLQQAIALMKAQGYVPKGDKEDMKAVVQTAVTLIRVGNPQFSLKTGGGGGIPSRGNVPGAVNGAGGSGPSARGNQKGTASQVKTLFDD